MMKPTESKTKLEGGVAPKDGGTPGNVVPEANTPLREGVWSRVATTMSTSATKAIQQWQKGGPGQAISRESFNSGSLIEFEGHPIKNQEDVPEDGKEEGSWSPVTKRTKKKSNKSKPVESPSPKKESKVSNNKADMKPPASPDGSKGGSKVSTVDSTCYQLLSLVSSHSLASLIILVRCPVKALINT